MQRRGLCAEPQSKGMPSVIWRATLSLENVVLEQNALVINTGDKDPGQPP